MYANLCSSAVCQAGSLSRSPTAQPGPHPVCDIPFWPCESLLPASPFQEHLLLLRGILPSAPQGSEKVRKLSRRVGEGRDMASS